MYSEPCGRIGVSCKEMDAPEIKSIISKIRVLLIDQRAVCEAFTNTIKSSLLRLSMTQYGWVERS